MSVDELYGIINYIVGKSLDMLKKYVNQKIELEYVAIFSQNKDEYDKLLNLTTSLGRIVDQTPTGPVFRLNSSIETPAGKLKLLKIRVPDPTRHQRGDTDFNTNYEKFKQKYLNSKGFSLIIREKFEMLELRDDEFDVLVYFSSISQSKLLGVV